MIPIGLPREIGSSRYIIKHESTSSPMFSQSWANETLELSDSVIAQA